MFDSVGLIRRVRRVRDRDRELISRGRHARARESSRRADVRGRKSTRNVVNGVGARVNPAEIPTDARALLASSSRLSGLREFRRLIN